MSDIVFEKTKGRGWAERVFKQKQPSKSFFKKRVMKHSAEFTRKHLCRNHQSSDTKPKAYVPI